MNNDDMVKCVDILRDALAKCESTYGGLAFVALGVVTACVLESRVGAPVAAAIELTREKIAASKN